MMRGEGWVDVTEPVVVVPRVRMPVTRSLGWAGAATEGVVRASERVVWSAVEAGEEVGRIWDDDVLSQ